jgi:hypothetical protein
MSEKDNHFPGYFGLAPIEIVMPAEDAEDGRKRKPNCISRGKALVALDRETADEQQNDPKVEEQTNADIASPSRIGEVGGFQPCSDLLEELAERNEVEACQPCEHFRVWAFDSLGCQISSTESENPLHSLDS